ncbi:DUF3574 domain-containing protein [Streptomyces sp.]|uniref:DUF3574 domain-containing protein n=1 Tax=Streptomyces sp. TaxID=1931 RepID=UPI002D504168|nr:DUF3574 domain-containing protein [Streptomyces sp.]HZF90536.1 DUF3574 domain-containing protein [Streptomyces sp.]
MTTHHTRTPHLILRNRPRTAVAAAGLLLAVAAPAAYAALDEDTGAPPRGTPYVETQLFFGTERPDGGRAVTERQFTEFLDREVAPAFPDGLTVQEGRGQWRDARGVVERERSYELILLYPVAEAAARDRGIEEIRRAYEKRFAQESVARVDLRTRVDF